MDQLVFTPEEFKELVFKSKKPGVLNEEFLNQWDSVSCITFGDNRIITPIMWAALNDHLDVIEYLLEKNKNDPDDLNSVIQSSAECGHLDTIKYLIEKNPGIIDIDEALSEAAGEGHLDVVKYCVKKGADVTADQNWALLAAAEYGHFDVLKYLIEQGADITADHYLVLSHAIELNDLDMVKYLIDKGADITADDNWAIMFTISLGHVDILKYLLSLNIYDEDYIRRQALSVWKGVFIRKEIKDLLTNYTAFSYTKAIKK